MSAIPDNEGFGITDLFSEYGVTRQGFQRPPVDHIWEVFVREAEDRFGKQITAVSEAELQYVEMAVLWTYTYFETLEALYYAGYYSHARDAQLDYLLEIVGFRRLERREATGEVAFTAANGTVSNDRLIQARTRVATRADEETEEIIFETTEPVTLREGESEVRQVPIRAVDPLDQTADLDDDQIGAATNVDAGTIERIIDPILGVGEVTNPLPTGGSGERADGTPYNFVSGRDRETDTQFRRRYEASLAFGGRATVDALEASIRNGGNGEIVQSVTVQEELPIVDNGDGTYSGRQFRPIVALEEDTPPARDEVIQAIYETRAGGIQSVGEYSGVATQATGEDYGDGLAFDPAEKIQIYVSAELETTDQFPYDGIDQLVENIVSRIGGELNGERYRGTEIGEDVYYHWILGDILDDSVPGWNEYNYIHIGTDPSPTGTSSVAIGDAELAVTGPDNITIQTV
ncbi:baseplate J/gp47 family protein [Halalkalicoccus jeotgali]|uniref:Baseplate J family protein n=1 Tax=Halalkalicoccus jeotgali (strain DSM 18796 / CECT 7217 / JCM 14584 / KCTC 4019 / B3) TaxID=795797 RepID=D8J9U0_HALJB|nr:baseplate J/gp47 family protein [Halalkalicoccus jeotgali]ADJ14462.1 Baseplate J family protein [Halalkalicoccus jeotgali B3]ELY40176.1 Baseplate J family protein [Halalkalicoccus jeotgali B3]